MMRKHPYIVLLTGMFAILICIMIFYYKSIFDNNTAIVSQNSVSFNEISENTISQN